jgi:hypothetical protein
MLGAPVQGLRVCVTYLSPVRFILFPRSDVGLITARARVHADKCSDLHKIGIWKPKGQMKLTDHLVITGGGAQRAVDMSIAKMVYANNMPFAMVNDTMFRQLVEVLRPGIPPSPNPTLFLLLPQAARCLHTRRCLASCWTWLSVT